MKSFFWLFFSLLCAFSLNLQGLFAQTNKLQLNSVEDAITLALSQNPDLAIYKLNQQKAIQELSNQKLSHIPTSSLGLGMQYNIDRATSVLPGEIFGKPGQTVNVQMGTNYAYNPGISLNWDVFNYQLPLKTKLSKIELELQNAQNEAFTQKIREQTAMYYYVALLIQQAIVINKEDLLALDSMQTLTQQKFQQGLVDLSAVNQSKIAVNNAKQSLTGNEKSLASYLNLLKNILGLGVEKTILFTEKRELNRNFNPNVVLNDDKNLNIYVIRKRLSLADIQFKKVAFYPKLSINSYLGFQQFTNDFEMNFTNDSWNKYNYVGFMLSVPITANFKNRGGLKIAEITDKINAQALQNEQVKAQNNDALLLKDYSNLLQQLEISANNYQLFKENLNLAFQKYSNGIISLDAYLKVNDDYLKAENLYLNTLSSVYALYSTILSRQ